MLLVLDLDETLIFATEKPLLRDPAFRVGPYHIYRRPHLDTFLDAAFARFRIGIWTSSTRDYAMEVVHHVFHDRAGQLEFLWAAEQCTLRFDPETFERYPLKNLRKLRDRGYDLERVVMVDDTAQKLERNYGNLVRVQPFEGDPGDDELERLPRFLHWLADQPNVRTIEKRGWRTHPEV